MDQTDTAPQKGEMTVAKRNAMHAELDAKAAQANPEAAPSEPRSTDAGQESFENAPRQDTDQPAAADPKPNGQAAAAPRRRKAKSPVDHTNRHYWIFGRSAPGRGEALIAKAPTIGQARKRLELVREMPGYNGWELWIARTVRVN